LSFSGFKTSFTPQESIPEGLCARKRAAAWVKTSGSAEFQPRTGCDPSGLPPVP